MWGKTLKVRVSFVDDADNPGGAADQRGDGDGVGVGHRPGDGGGEAGQQPGDGSADDIGAWRRWVRC